MGASLLIPLDGSPLAEEAIAAVVPLLDRDRIELTLLRVVPSVGPVMGDGRVVMTADEATELHRQEAAEYLGRVAAALRRRGIRAHARVAAGDPPESIVGEAVGSGAAAIAMATHGRTGLGRLIFGSVTAAVVKASPIPVLTVHMAASRRAMAPATSTAAAP